jgi:hypothetical protein
MGHRGHLKSVAWLAPPDAAPDQVADRPVPVERRDSTLWITINRPGFKNALDLVVAALVTSASSP